MKILTYARATLMVIQMAGQPSAAGFLGWTDRGCRGEAIQDGHILEPFQCFTANEMMSSIRAHGLSNTNNPSGSKLTLFRDLHCSDYVTTIKHSRYCINSIYGSLLYVPESDEDAHANASIIMTEEDQRQLASERQEGLELDMMLDKAVEEFERKSPGDPGRRLVQREGSVLDEWQRAIESV